MIHLHIKGSMVAAFAAADTRKIELTSIAQRTRDGGISDCFATTTAPLNKVREWWYEDCEIIEGYGYPAGSLLFFSCDEATS